jgi:hypothetical protein
MGLKDPAGTLVKWSTGDQHLKSYQAIKAAIANPGKSLRTE